MPDLNRILRLLTKVDTSVKMESTGIVACQAGDGGMDYRLRACHPDGITNDPHVELYVEMFNAMPSILALVDRLHYMMEELEGLGFDEDEGISGGDTVDLIASHYPVIKAALADLQSTAPGATTVKG